MTDIEVHEACLADMTAYKVIVSGSGTSELFLKLWWLRLQTLDRSDILSLLVRGKGTPNK
jgi:hypothetical protein